MKRCIMNKKSYDLTVDLSGSDTQYITSHRPIYVTYKNIKGPIIINNSDTLIFPRTINFFATPGKGLLEIPGSNKCFSNVSKEIEISNYNKSETVSVALKKYTLGIKLNGTNPPYLLAGNTTVSPIAWNSTYTNSRGYGIIYFSGIPAGECTINIEENEYFEPYTIGIDLYSDTTITANLDRKASVFTIVVTINPNVTIYEYSSGEERREIEYTYLTVDYVDQYGYSQNKQISSGYNGITTSFTCLKGTTFYYSGSSSGKYTSNNELYVGGNTNYVQVDS